MPAKKAHTSDGTSRPNAPEDDGDKAYTVASSQLRAFIERVERLLEDRASIGEDIAQVYAEMKGTGFDIKAVRELVKLRKQDQAARQEHEAKLDLYKTALGME